MTHTTGTSGSWRDVQVIGLISAAHFVSHFYIMLLQPILGVVRAEFDVSYIAIGFALTAFNVVSATLQTPVGFLVDRVGPRPMLIGGMLLGGAALIVAALVPNYWVFVAMFAVLGLANTVYHPADYALLSASIGGSRIGKAFSVHTFAGYLGTGIAPAVILFCATMWNWRGAYLIAAAIGVVVALLVLMFGRVLVHAPVAKPGTGAAAPDAFGWRLLFTGPILRNLLFFALIAIAGGGLSTYTVVGLGALHGTSASVANMALSGFLLLSAVGVLIGGFIADKTTRHERVAAICFAATAAMVVLIGEVDLGAVVLVLVMSLGGVLNGVIQPSRDMMVRAVTPPGAFGKVFGFVTTGFNLGGMVSPILFGWLMDRGEPRLIFVLVAVFMLLSLLTVLTRPKPAAVSAQLAASRS
jgi:MFS transporter, FSR family, fosmidomycin resistance protein